MHNVPKWPGTLKEPCTRCCKIFKIGLLILGCYPLKSKTQHINLLFIYIVSLAHFRSAFSFYIPSKYYFHGVLKGNLVMKKVKRAIVCHITSAFLLLFHFPKALIHHLHGLALSHYE